MRQSARTIICLILLTSAVVLATLLAGCGGGHSTDGDGSTPPQLTSVTTARFQVNVLTKEVKIVPNRGQGEVSTSALWTGDQIRLTSSNLITQTGDAGRFCIQVSITNYMTETIASTARGIRAVIDNIDESTGRAVYVANADGRMPSLGWYDNLPYFDFQGPLPQDATVGPRDWWFEVADGVSTFTFDVSVFADPQGPASLPAATGAGSPQVVVRSVAGASGAGGTRDGAGVSALFGSAIGMATDAVGNLYVSTCQFNNIRKITPTGMVSTLAGYPDGAAGSTDGSGPASGFSYPTGIAASADGSLLFVCDSGNHTIRLLVRGTGTNPYISYTISGAVGTAGYAEGAGDVARFDAPFGLVYDEPSMTLFITETYGHRVRSLHCTKPKEKTKRSAWYSSLIAGSVTGASGHLDGQGSGAMFKDLHGIALDSSGVLYVADEENHCIRRINASRTVTTFAGTTIQGYQDGLQTAARFKDPNGLAIDSAGYIYVTDSSNSRIRRISPEGLVSTVAGSAAGHLDGLGNTARFYDPWGCAIDPHGSLFVSDGMLLSRIRMLTRVITVNTTQADATSAPAEWFPGPAWWQPDPPSRFPRLRAS